MPPRSTLPFDPIDEATRNWNAAGWSDVSDGMALVTSIMRAQQLFLARVDEVLAPFGLTFARFEVLMLLSFSQRGELPLGKIGQRLQVHPASVTNAIDRLESGGLVVRVPHPHDGRTTLAALTDDGRALAGTAVGQLNREVFGAIGLGSEQVRSVIEAITTLRAAAGDFAAEATPAPG
ncbi:MAG: MarR family transcriptional regulator [Ilumatobacteraceae bacterium]|nr:MarR family transcriptional regulator [Ilumatobacteraceae bacterium]